jgi:hypothetical protein
MLWIANNGKFATTFSMQSEFHPDRMNHFGRITTYQFIDLRTFGNDDVLSDNFFSRSHTKSSIVAPVDLTTLAAP